MAQDRNCYSCCCPLINQYFFSPKVFISLTLFILTCIRKRALQRLRKGFRNITFNEKKLESTSNTAGASENFHFRSLLWESPELLLGLCSLLFSAPFHSLLTLQYCHRRNPLFFFLIHEYLRKKLSAPSIGEREVLASSLIWICEILCFLLAFLISNYSWKWKCAQTTCLFI